MGMTRRIPPITTRTRTMFFSFALSDRAGSPIDSGSIDKRVLDQNPVNRTEYPGVR